MSTRPSNAGKRSPAVAPSRSTAVARTRKPIADPTTMLRRRTTRMRRRAMEPRHDRRRLHPRRQGRLQTPADPHPLPKGPIRQSPRPPEGRSQLRRRPQTLPRNPRHLERPGAVEAGFDPGGAYPAAAREERSRTTIAHSRRYLGLARAHNSDEAPERLATRAWPLEDQAILEAYAEEVRSRPAAGAEPTPDASQTGEDDGGE